MIWVGALFFTISAICLVAGEDRASGLFAIAGVLCLK